MSRRPLDANDQTCRVSVSLPNRQLADLRAEAERRRCSLPEVIRRKLRAVDKKDRPSQS
jgi:hypothetical protein